MQLKQSLLEASTEADVRAVILMLIQKAKGGDVQAASVLLDRWFGKASQPIELSTDAAEGQPPHLLAILNNERLLDLANELQQQVSAQQQALDPPQIVQAKEGPP